VLLACALLATIGSGVASAHKVHSQEWGIADAGIGLQATPTRLRRHKGSSPIVNSGPGCPVTVTGSVDGGLVVPTDQTYCLLGAHIHGPTSVQPGGELTISNSTLDGGLTSYGATAVWVCGSTVNGSTLIANGGGTVMVGADGDDGSAQCAADTLHGGVAIVWNQAGVELGGDWITGPVAVDGNEGPAFRGTDVGAEVEGNHISGPLSCSSNFPAPTNDGLQNTVTGPEKGQCEGF
jgi:hexosaminidase